MGKSYREKEYASILWDSWLIKLALTCVLPVYHNRKKQAKAYSMKSLSDKKLLHCTITLIAAGRRALSMLRETLSLWQRHRSTALERLIQIAKRDHIETIWED